MIPMVRFSVSVEVKDPDSYRIIEKSNIQVMMALHKESIMEVMDTTVEKTLRPILTNPDIQDTRVESLFNFRIEDAETYRNIALYHQVRVHKVSEIGAYLHSFQTVFLAELNRCITTHGGTEDNV